MEKEDPLKFLKNILSEVETDTQKHVGDDWALWVNHYNTWIDVIGSVLDVIPKEKQFDSMLVFRLLELHKTLLWLQVCALYGAYHQLIRELRFALDSFLQAYYLDKNYATMQEKVEIILKEGRSLFGSRLIDKLESIDKGELKQTYRNLSTYQHSSYEEMRSALEDGKVDDRVVFTFDKELFHECKILTNTVIDSVFYLVLINFPNAILKLKSDEMTVYWLKQLDSKLILKLMGQQ